MAAVWDTMGGRLNITSVRLKGSALGISFDGSSTWSGWTGVGGGGGGGAGAGPSVGLVVVVVPCFASLVTCWVVCPVGTRLGGAVLLLVTRPITGGAGWTANDRAVALAKNAWSEREIDPLIPNWKLPTSLYISFSNSSRY